ncbi:hypothetical protein MKZ26_20165 [Sporosarcina sp. FSL K6-6792]|uniref:hypothetical protein n=1 Tax=Sporosarcina sp. FSL K6-6792 TaxID=2921559 RepID=UPI0030FB0EB6
MNEYLKDKLLLNAIQAHKRIISEGEAVDLASINFEEGTPFERVHQYNAFMILSKLDFERDEVLNVASDSRKYLDELAAKDLPNDTIIQTLLEYRQSNVNS